MLGQSFVILSLLAAFISAEYGTNYNIGNHQRQETIDANGDITGHYSYIDPNGQTITVHYTAGKNGYQVVNKPSNNIPVITTAAPGFYRPTQLPVFQSYQRPTNFITPYTEYKGLQLRHNKYQGLFRPAAANAIYPAATPKQYSAYADALRQQQEEDFKTAQQKANVLPAQFPSNNEPPAPISTPQPYFSITPQYLGNFFNSLQDISYDGQPTNVISKGETDLGTVAANPLPPQQVNNYANRESTPITEDQEGPIQNSYNIQYQYY